ncbi:hypothetical protein QJS04_geneDACA010341 [Acorus gramineus]|uniref:RRM domain-containing protein n=1 Tax=Acorus gramineus TaxID=55184 RepID=A0AAV9A5G3_ACOGR|nr:hypothetical protein QJS04_geneDACA010341 [Acorus gramineus]
MDDPDRLRDLNFRVSFSDDGLARLKEEVTEKLKGYMGDYTDDHLVEYVIVLLKNGKNKEEAKKQLDVFLGDDSVSFVCWLWDHLSSNLHLYVQPNGSDEVSGTKPVINLTGGKNSSTEHASGLLDDSDNDTQKKSKDFRTRRKREWKGLVQHEVEAPPLQSTEIENVHKEETNHRGISHVKRSHSPIPQVQAKRHRLDERSSMKRDVASKPAMGAPRRLLQFAVRDAVGTSKQQNSRPERVSKRLRSVVSTSTMDVALDDQYQKTRSTGRVQSAVATAIKAAAEAAEDVIKPRFSGSVFDRLGNSKHRAKPIDQTTELGEHVMEDGEFEDFDQHLSPENLDYCQRSDNEGESAGDITMLEKDTRVASDTASDNDRYENMPVVKHRIGDASQTASSGNKEKNSLMVQYSVAKDTDEVIRKTRLNDQDSSVPSVANASRKIVNISVNVNTWKPPHYQEPRDSAEVEARMTMGNSEAVAAKSTRLMKENNVAVAEAEKVTPRLDLQKEAQKSVLSTLGSYSTVRPSEDADLRTLFVSNVHFAATKDTLSRHFNKFGEVLKVVIVTDAATGQPKGSAYVEFMRKESAEHALSLNGTSFMSRILKVVQRSSAEASPLMTWPRMVRATPFAARLAARGPFTRGITSPFRARLPIKPGARSLQWKRETGPATPTSEVKQSTASTSGSNVLSPTGRNLTYVRPEPNLNGNSAPA